MITKAFIFCAALVAVTNAAPFVSTKPESDDPYTIMYDGPDGRHVQKGEPGKAVYGYYISRSDDGQKEYKTTYEADDKGFRATGDHIPDAPTPSAEARTGGAPKYVFNYKSDEQSHYQMGEPGKAVEGSYTYYDTEGRARRVDYIADEKGYRIKPEVAADDAVNVKADEPEAPPSVKVESPPTDDATPIVVPEEVHHQLPAEDAPKTEQVHPAAEDAPKTEEVKQVMDPWPAVETQQPKVTAEVVIPVEELIAEQKSSSNVEDHLVNLPIMAYYRTSLPYYTAPPPFRYSPYGYGYNIAYPFGGNYGYAY